MEEFTRKIAEAEKMPGGCGESVIVHDDSHVVLNRPTTTTVGAAGLREDKPVEAVVFFC